ncbi:MAG: SpoIIE family protein phosphatase [Salinivirgaceae bacterium]|nr:SpoIIE family protein phosphatase [Salinivirgaceae bacterium]
MNLIKDIFKVLLLAVVLATATGTTRAQSGNNNDWATIIRQLDSTRIAVQSMPDDTAKLSRYYFICRYCYDVDTAGKYCKLLLDLAQKFDNQYYIAHGYSYLARYYYWAADYDKARDLNMEAIYLWEKLESKYHLARLNTQLATILTAQGLYDQASKYYHMSLDVFREIGDTAHITQILQNLGNVNIFVRFYQNATNYFTQALAIDSSINNVYGLIADHAGLARVYVNKYKRHRRDSLAEEWLQLSKYHLDTAYALALPLPNIIEMQQLHIYKAMVYMELAENAKGKEMKAALDSCELHCNLLIKLIHDYNLRANMSGAVTIQGRAQLCRGNLDSALKYFKRAEELIAIENPRREIKKELLLSYQKYYETIGDYRKANEYLKELVYLLMDNSNDEVAARVATSKTRMDFEQKMRQRVLEEYEHEQQYKAKVERQRLLMIAIISSLLVISIIILVSSMRRKKLILMLNKKNEMLDEKNYQLVAAKEELQSQNELLNAANKSITDSIIYAKHIQEAVIPTRSMMQQIFGNCLVMFHPCNIVSGDFYWAVKIGRYKALVVADCTGHGVPGAFMSMLGISMLNDIVANIDMNSEQLQASDILNQLRANVISALRQDINAMGGLDGIDMALILIDSDRRQLQYSGAYRPLVMIRDNSLTKIECDHMPIGKYNKNTPFTNHVIELEKGDCFFAYSDGITDQFDNSNEQKFGRKKLYGLLLDNYQKPFTEQFDIYKNAFESWRMDGPRETPTEQTDDVVLVGIKIE